MIAVGFRSIAERTRRILVPSLGLHGIESEGMIGGDDASISPTPCLRERPAGMVLPAGVHRNNQLPLVMAGTRKAARMQPWPAPKHLAGANAAYGPLAALPARGTAFRS